MKRHLRLTIFLAVEAIVCVAAGVLSITPTSVYQSIAAFPYEPLGDALRWMSLSGPAGNVFAILLYVFICLLPLLWFVGRLARKGYRTEDLLLLAWAAVLAPAMYGFINPGLFSRFFPNTPEIGRIMLASTVDSVAVAYLTFRLMRYFRGTGAGKLLGALRVFLAMLAAALVYLLFRSDFHAMITDLHALTQGNTEASFARGLTALVICLRYAAGAVPTCMQIAMLYRGLSLADALRRDRYGQEALQEAGGLAALAQRTAAAIVLTAMGVNLVQIALSPWLLTMHYQTELPLLSLLLTLSTLLMARDFTRSAALKRENDAFI